MSYKLISMEAKGRIVTITLKRPEVMNAINKAMVKELHRAFDELRDDTEHGCVIIVGEGKNFVAGADIGELKERKALESLAAINSALFRKIEEHPVPVIAAIQGYCLGGGCELALACDIRVAGKSAQFGQPEVGLGIIPAAGGTQRLPRIIGMGRAKEWVLTAWVYDAEEAYRVGLANHLVDDEAVMDRAIEIAERILKRGPLAVRVAKTALNASARTGLDTGLTIESVGQALLFDSEDKNTRMSAFLNRKQKS
ncbi:MAG: enoyl-CoA hydratase-related protein [Planctomycetes bacterium]|nr:enoyl-CoA hydratase-related protein [Planctomycetota bacterium]NUQ33734.1 enoyl-CoA hydratase/isomerase family protein [Planctomycetaceae bacterium]